MKKRLPILLFCAWGVVAMAQQDITLFQLGEEASEIQFRNNDFIIDSTICFQYQADLGALLPASKEITIAVNEAGNITEKRTEIYDLAQNIWVKHNQVLATFDSGENLQEQLVKIWNANSQTYENSQRASFTLNPSGQATEVLHEIWSNGWQNELKEIYLYGSGPNAGHTLLQIQRWENDAWQNVNQTSISYNAQGLPGSTLFQFWSDTDGWVNGNRSFESYNGADLLVESRREFYDVAANDWILSSRVTNTYQGNNLEEALTELWDGVNETWIFNQRVLNTFDVDNQKIEELSQGWIGTGWGNIFKSTFQYDEHGNLTRSDGELWENDNWRPQNACNLFWSALMSNALQVYENSWNCTITNPYIIGTSFNCDMPFFEMNTLLEIYDLKGVLHFSKKIQSSSDLVIHQQLSHNLYVLVMTEPKGIVYRKKIIVK